MKKYDVDYFIEKFEAIPANKWTTGSFETRSGRHCALGHCGETHNRSTNESYALYGLFHYHHKSVCFVNDTCCSSHPQKTPRARILAVLKNMQKKTGKG